MHKVVKKVVWRREASRTWHLGSWAAGVLKYPNGIKLDILDTQIGRGIGINSIVHSAKNSQRQQCERCPDERCRQQRAGTAQGRKPEPSVWKIEISWQMRVKTTVTWENYNRKMPVIALLVRIYEIR